MEVLAILGAIIGLGLVLVFVGAMWMYALVLLWNFWPIVAAIVFSVALWRAGHDNWAVIVFIIMIALQFVWAFTVADRVEAFRL
jgi:hypothetical protein